MQFMPSSYNFGFLSGTSFHFYASSNFDSKDHSLLLMDDFNRRYSTLFNYSSLQATVWWSANGMVDFQLVLLSGGVSSFRIGEIKIGDRRRKPLEKYVG